ncbi:hypothetical protein IMSAGC003_01063 [Lachnospiraceae bacterium]|nr:DUF2812 domain-containing protein [Acetatifactor sp.]GFH94531.1 hypothetical protein IMSAGC003_01063 [Lachnospiraceae bacterium]
MRKMRLFTIADFKEEEEWLEEMHRSGWKLIGMTPPCFFYFARCRPEEVVYQLDFRNRRDGYGSAYLQMFRDCGWEYVDSCMSFHYFRKPAALMEEEEEIFSDNVSRADLLGRIWKWRMMPVFFVFFGCLLPQIWQGVLGNVSRDMIFYLSCGILFLYLWIIFHVGMKFFRMKRLLRQDLH